VEGCLAKLQREKQALLDQLFGAPQEIVDAVLAPANGGEHANVDGNPHPKLLDEQQLFGEDLASRLGAPCSQVAWWDAVGGNLPCLAIPGSGAGASAPAEEHRIDACSLVSSRAPASPDIAAALELNDVPMPENAVKDELATPRPRWSAGMLSQPRSPTVASTVLSISSSQEQAEDTPWLEAPLELACVEPCADLAPDMEGEWPANSSWMTCPTHGTQEHASGCIHGAAPAISERGSVAVTSSTTSAVQQHSDVNVDIGLMSGTTATSPAPGRVLDIVAPDGSTVVALQQEPAAPPPDVGATLLQQRVDGTICKQRAMLHKPYLRAQFLAAQDCSNGSFQASATASAVAQNEPNRNSWCPVDSFEPSAPTITSLATCEPYDLARTSLGLAASSRTSEPRSRSVSRSRMAMLNKATPTSPAVCAGYAEGFDSPSRTAEGELQEEGRSVRRRSGEVPKLPASSPSSSRHFSPRSSGRFVAAEPCLCSGDDSNIALGRSGSTTRMSFAQRMHRRARTSLASRCESEDMNFVLPPGTAGSPPQLTQVAEMCVDGDPQWCVSGVSASSSVSKLNPSKAIQKERFDTNTNLATPGPCGQKVNSNTQWSPSTMTMEDLQHWMAFFGMKPSKSAGYMVRRLTEIDAFLQGSSGKRKRSASDEATTASPGRSGVRRRAAAEPKGQMPKRPREQGDALVELLVEAIKSDSNLYERLLLYEPVEVGEVRKSLASFRPDLAGLGESRLRAVLDSQGILFATTWNNHPRTRTFWRGLWRQSEG